MESLVSILIPTYNRVSFLKEAVESCLSQTYSSIEVVILDDGSTDGTREWAESLTDARVRYHHKVHRGPEFLADITNEMLDVADGQYIAILDHDDFYRDSLAVETMVEAIQEEDTSMVFGSIEPVDSSGKPLRPIGWFTIGWHQQLGCNSWSHADFVSKLLQFDFIPAPATLIATDALRSLGGFQAFSGFPATDYPTWLALSLRFRIRYVDRIITAYRVHGGQVSQEQGVEVAESALRIARHYFDQAVQLNILPLSDLPWIERSHRLQIGWMCWRRIQALAPEGQWGTVRTLATRQIALGNAPLKVEGIVAYLLSYFHVDAITPLLAIASRLHVRVNDT